jgi:hypothetical protein
MYPDDDGKTKLEHVQDMLLNCVYQKSLDFWAILMDIWYATKGVMLQLEKLGKIYYCPLKDNRQVDDSDGRKPYQRVNRLIWSKAEKQPAKSSKSKVFLPNIMDNINKVRTIFWLIFFGDTD